MAAYSYIPDTSAQSSKNCSIRQKLNTERRPEQPDTLIVHGSSRFRQGFYQLKAIKSSTWGGVVGSKLQRLLPSRREPRQGAPARISAVSRLARGNLMEMLLVNGALDNRSE
jgi:hypothetical protein